MYSNDTLNQLVTKHYNDRTATVITYHDSENKIATLAENGETVSFTYDSLHRVVSIGTSLHDWTMEYTYNAGDRVMGVLGGDGLTSRYDEAYQYYADGSLSRLE